jgi:hypothetical protein
MNIPPASISVSHCPKDRTEQVLVLVLHLMIRAIKRKANVYRTCTRRSLTAVSMFSFFIFCMSNSRPSTVLLIESTLFVVNCGARLFGFSMDFKTSLVCISPMLCAIYMQKMPDPCGRILDINCNFAGDLLCRVESHALVGVGINAAENQHCMMRTGTLVFAPFQ